MTFKTGFVTLVGRPNVGKSSLVNAILGKKVSIVSAKPQTTRNNIRGIVTKANEYQIILVDTPGIHSPKQVLDKFMNASAFKSVRETDLTLFLVPANETVGKNDLLILNDLRKKQLPVFLVVTKTDLVSKSELVQKLSEWSNLSKGLFTNIVPLSINNVNSVETLIKLIVETLPENDYQFFGDDTITDQPQFFLVKEIIRESILLKTGQEVPHSIAVLVDQLTDCPTELNIVATIIVERTSQKGIIIGKFGKKIQDIKYKSRKQLRELFGKDVHLELFVKVQPNWRSSPSLVKKMGYNKGKY